MTQDELKKAVARAAVEYIEKGDIIGVGTGSTVNHFIDELKQIKSRIDAAVASSIITADKLQEIGIRVLDLNQVGDLRIYVDGADEVTPQGNMIKGGGGALTREKIVAESSEQFVCIVDESKVVRRLGDFPLPVEVVPMAKSLVTRRLVKLGGIVQLRSDFITDNGNIILDVKNLDLTDPAGMENSINNIPGVVTNGLFARNRASVVLSANANGVETIVVQASFST